MGWIILVCLHWFPCEMRRMAMNSKVAFCSMIQDAVLRSITLGMFYHKRQWGKISSTARGFVFPYHLFITRRLFGRHCFSGEYTFQTGTALTPMSDQWFPAGLSKIVSVRRQGHHTLPEDRRTGRIIPPQKIRTLGVDTSSALCSCREKGTWLMAFSLSQSKETFAFYLFSAWVGAFPKQGVPTSQVGIHCHLLALGVFTHRIAFLAKTMQTFPDSLFRNIRKYQDVSHLWIMSVWTKIKILMQ